jgi:hypothetical protein
MSGRVALSTALLLMKKVLDDAVVLAAGAHHHLHHPPADELPLLVARLTGQQLVEIVEAHVVELFREPGHVLDAYALVCADAKA